MPKEEFFRSATAAGQSIHRPGLSTIPGAVHQRPAGVEKIGSDSAREK